MKIARVTTFCLAASAVFAAFAYAQETKPEKTATKAATKLSEPTLRPEALNAARAVAIEKLLDRVGKLKMGSNGKSTVGDLMADSDEIKAVVLGYLCSLETKGEPKYAGARDKKCTVTMEASVRDLQQALGENFRVYLGKKFKTEDIETIRKLNDKDTLSETASGEAEPQKWLPDGKAVKVTIDGYSHESLLTGDAKKYWIAHCNDDGRLEAVKKARARAVESLLEQAGWLKIGDTTVRQLVGDSWGDPKVTAELASGAREMTVLYYEHAPIVEVTVEMRLRGFYASLRSWAKTHGKDKAVLDILTRMSLKAKDESRSATCAAAVDAKYLKDVDKKTMAALTVAGSDVNLTESFSKTLVGENKEPLRVNAIALLTLKVYEAKITPDLTVGEYAAGSDAFRRTLIEFLQRVETTDGEIEGGKPTVTAEINLKPLWYAIVYHVRKDGLKIK